MSDYYFGYINENGYLAVVRFNTMMAYNNIHDSNPPIFIPKFQCDNYVEATDRILSILKLCINSKGSGVSF